VSGLVAVDVRPGLPALLPLFDDPGQFDPVVALSSSLVAGSAQATPPGPGVKATVISQGAHEQQAPTALVVRPDLNSAWQRCVRVPDFGTKPFTSPPHRDVARSVCVQDGVGDHLAGQQLDGLQCLVRQRKPQILGQRDSLAACGRDSVDSSRNRESVRRTFGTATLHDDNLTSVVASVE
jgi:hypothetical protein